MLDAMTNSPCRLSAQFRNVPFIKVLATSKWSSPGFVDSELSSACDLRLCILLPQSLIVTRCGGADRLADGVVELPSQRLLSPESVPENATFASLPLGEHNRQREFAFSRGSPVPSCTESADCR
jgi:hypothetical protein